MRYHYEKPTIYTSMYGETYICNHPVCSRCTLYKISSRGLEIIQQRFYHKNKRTWWSEIDPWLTDSLYLDPKFKAFFDRRAKDPVNNLYPTVTIRQNMWALKLKPIPKQPWETYFDRKDI